jgi:hypothetical protein
METNWEYMKPGDDEHLYFEDGSRRRITCSDFVMTWWEKYKGMTVAEISDLRDLTWLLKIAKEKSDWYVEKIISMRLKELEHG